jgi:opacity protein-like surface antigen
MYFFAEGDAKSTIIFPTSPEAIQKEEKFLKKVARKAFGEGKESNIKKNGETIKADDICQEHACVSHEENSQNSKASNSNINKQDLPKSRTMQLGIDYNLQNDVPAFPLTTPSKSHDAKEIRETPKKEAKPRRVFVGFYCGAGGNIMNVYPNAELWSQRYKPVEADSVLPGNKTADLGSIFYGSYAYNNNNPLVRGKLFAGYDLSINKLLRLGVEIQGGIGWGESEITSSGVYTQRSEQAPQETIYIGGQDTKEVDFAYVRPTISSPYAWSLLQKFGITLSQWALLYTKLGFSYENIRVTDHEEEIDVGVQVFPKEKPADVIFQQNKAAFIAGVGVEATIRSQLFLRMECFFTKGGRVHLQKDKLIDAKDPNARVLEELNVKCRSVSVGFGAGFRF